MAFASLLAAMSGCAATRQAGPARSEPAQAPSPSPAAPTPSSVALAVGVAAAQQPPPNIALQDDEHLVENARRMSVATDQRAREDAAKRILSLATDIASPQWREANRDVLARANRLAQVSPTREQVEVQLDMWQTQRLARACQALSLFPSDDVVSFGFGLASNAALPVERRGVGLRLLDDVVRPDQLESVHRREQLRVEIAAEEQKQAAEPQHDAARVVAAMRAGFRACYQKQLSQAAPQDIDTRLTLRVGVSGKVLSSKLDPPTPEVLAKCIRERASRARFAPYQEARVIEVPIRFVKPSSP